MSKKHDTSNRSGDRHKGKRHTVTLRADEYEALAQLAERNDRPILWELRRILHAALREAGLWSDGGTAEDEPVK